MINLSKHVICCIFIRATLC